MALPLCVQVELRPVLGYRMKRVSVHRTRLRWQGKYLVNNGALGPNPAEPNPAQCVNVVNCAAKLLNLGASYGDAIELDYVGAQWVDNQPDNFPPAGAVVIFLNEWPYDPVAGHTGWALHNCTPDELHLLWQNDPDGSPVRAVITDYTACKGWFILHSETAEWSY
jgi:hypothetical protein